MASEYTDMAACLDACAGLSTKRSFLGLGTSPQGRCQATCGKTVRYQAGYGDPDEMYDIAIEAMIEAEFQANAGTPSFGGGDTGDTYYSNGNGASTRQGDPTLMLGAAALIAGLLYMGLRK